MAHTADWSVTGTQYLASRGFDVLVFHNDYFCGKQAGLELIHHGVRTAMRGDVSLVPLPHDGDERPRLESREVAPDGASVTAHLRYGADGFAYAVTVRPEGDDLHVVAALKDVPPAASARQAVFHLFCFPDVYRGRCFVTDRHAGVFPRQYSASCRAAGLPAGVLARGTVLHLAPDEPACSLTIRAAAGELELLDASSWAVQGDLMVRSVLDPDKPSEAAHWIITPRRIPGWLKPPEVQASQVGYHPGQRKVAVVELDAADAAEHTVSLVRIDAGGEQVVRSGPVRPWGRFLRYAYGHFDFTEVRRPGLYRLTCAGRSTGVFRIGEDVYAAGIWQPTLETFLAVQMCHVEVRDRERVWHGACHLDDALQAPAGTKHFDGYYQSEPTASPLSDLERMPGLGVGGWHDAGDFDLHGWSQIRTTYYLALAAEAFGADCDHTTVLPQRKLVLLHEPDGVPDIVQQVAHGARALLAPWRACGHSIFGIIAATFRQYGITGDPVNMTAGTSDRPGRTSAADPVPKGPRWVFTTPSIQRDYEMAAVLAAAARVLAPFEPALADECLGAAREAFDKTRAAQAGLAQPEQQRKVQVSEIGAAVELLLTTGEDRYAEAIAERSAAATSAVGEAGWRVARVLDRVGGAGLRAALAAAVAEHCGELARKRSESPYGIVWHSAVWGIGWGLLWQAVQEYYLWRAFPRIVDPEGILAVVNYTLGCHPGPGLSLVSGVGSRSMTIAYGFNRDDNSYIPGGVVSGPAHVLPDLLELRDGFPFLWQQSEYVIGGAAAYVFCVLAADDILNAGPRPG